MDNARQSTSTSTVMSGAAEKSPDTAVPDQPFKLEPDIERASVTGSILPPDPFQFRESKFDDEALSQLRHRRKGKRVAKYQRRQNDLIDSLLKPMEAHTEEAQIEEEAARLSVKIAVYGSLIANFALCILQSGLSTIIGIRLSFTFRPVYAAISSISLSLLATGIDSVFDIGSNLVLFWLHKKAQRLDENKWPVGGSRLETIGNIVYGSLMSSVNLIVIVESLRTIVSKEGNDLIPFHLPSIIAVASALVVKFILFLYCYSIRKQSSQVQILWEDHRNDLWINSFGVLMSCGGSKLRWYLDPMGGIIIASGIVIAWGRTIYHQFELLAGKSAPHEFLQLLIYKAATFNEDIIKVDTVRAYHSGPEYFVEIDVVMDMNTPLWKAHDISQQLQDKIEALPNVERAFVHVDHETTHTPEHRKTKLIIL
ncbi:hypothetical protein NP233_g4275 [Leucocoprinus birnbaumii]|uniref:Cation efflux protein cytoplasmic domain-containing protein n=1 Tax=Leucocoprinus birnbaumii TaxID=56174 RepID=A0AAD5VVD1_9AGAR|nr:hypothetical protein NP233_g4275 [Leucocoprinus birnbaumii]